MPTDKHSLAIHRRAQRLRDRRRRERAGIEGWLGDALRGRNRRRQRLPLPCRRAAVAGFDGHANCFIETGFGKALLIDFNYDTEPLPGHYPGAVGLPLLKESRLNHLGKLMFQWFYWHSLLPGRDIPGLSASMPTAGASHPTPPPPSKE